MAYVYYNYKIVSLYYYMDGSINLTFLSSSETKKSSHISSKHLTMAPLSLTIPM